MSQGAGKDLPGNVSAAADLLPLKVLLHCRTVVEKQNFVTTGIMTHVEGELFEIELSEFELFELGETVKLTVYSPAGIQMLHSTVFAKYDGAIALIQPPGLQKRFEERREHPRVAIVGSATVQNWLDDTGRPSTVNDPVVVQLRDISLTGIGFEAPDMPQFSRKSRLRVDVDIGFGFHCELEVIRRERQEDDMLLCGAKMKVLEPEKMRPLRALILRQQVERNVELRRQSDRERKR